MPEAEIRQRISAYELKQWELLESIQPWGSRYLAARIIQSIAGGDINQILAALKNEKIESDDEAFLGKIKMATKKKS